MKKLFSLLFLLCVSVISYAQIIEAVHWRFSVKGLYLLPIWMTDGIFME